MRPGIISVLIFFHFSGVAQVHYLLSIVPSDRDSSFLTKEFSYKQHFPDSLSRNKEQLELLSKLYQKGFLEADYLTTFDDSTVRKATLFVGRQWLWAKLSNGNVDDVILDRIGFRERLYNSKPFEISQVNQLLNNLVQYCENNGYPFASAKLDSIKSDGEYLSAKIFLTKNQLITLDTIIVKGDAKISSRYLANYLGIRTPSIYKEDVLKKVSSRLRDLPFLTEERSAEIVYNNDRASLTMFLKKKTASRFDFILGVLPNSNSSGKLLITGDGQLYLNNAFGKGESFGLQFSQLQSRTTEVHIKGSYPYLFGVPFGIDGAFELYKNDTLYLDVKEQIGIQYLFTGFNYLKAFFRNANNSILSVDTNQVIQTKTLPAYLDIKTKFYGIEYQLEQVNYRFNPTRGAVLYFNGQAGNRKIEENTKITELKDPSNPEFDFSSLYDSVETKETQFRLSGSLNKYWSVSSRSVFKTGYSGGTIISNDIFSNELYRIGGFHLLRGFDEQSVFVSQYHVFTVEYHYLLSLNSFFYLFFDGAYTENTSAIPATYDTPLGFGAGLNFETKAGIFGLSYALGRQQSNPIEFKAAKIHFGYVNYF